MQNFPKWSIIGEDEIVLTTYRYKLKGVQHVIFYEPPLYQECYTHYLNMITAEEGTSTLIYNKLVHSSTTS